ncbi:MAG: anti-sigma regulatory factor (Ser/Thr protein kinase) [Saprospiraceae bacterium]|jgi:anti-sigma regulatory factor (Ser/Thr protein kinase)
MKKPEYHIKINGDGDVGLVREAATIIARESGFDAIEVGEITLAVSEIAQNAWRHAGGGTAEVYSLKNGKVLRIIIKDNGKGIENIELAMREGFSTIRTSLGIGLEAAQRLTDKFEIQSKEDGTTVILEKHLPMRTDRIEYGLVSVPDEDYNFNGDEFLIKEFDGDKIFLAVIDGIGQGYEAYAMSVLIKNFLSENYELPLDSLILSCDSLLKNTELSGGAAMGIALVEPGQLTYLGIGDTHCYLFGKDENKALQNYEGRVGDYQLPSISAKQYPLSEDITIVMCTDGINTKVADTEFDSSMSAQNAANYFFNEFHKTHGDVTVLVTKIKSPL